MGWEELLASKGYVHYGKCCGGWNKYSNRPGHPPESVIRIKGNKIKVMVNWNGRLRYFLKELSELEQYVNG